MVDVKPIDRLIINTIAWREEHRAKGRRIEAAAASIRLTALQDAKAAIEKEEREKTDDRENPS